MDLFGNRNFHRVHTPQAEESSNTLPRICMECRRPVAPWVFRDPRHPHFGQQCECVSPVGSVQAHEAEVHRFRKECPDAILADLDQALPFVHSARKQAEPGGMLHIKLSLLVDEILDTRTLAGDLPNARRINPPSQVEEGTADAWRRLGEGS